jgi:hypothetical protein
VALSGLAVADKAKAKPDPAKPDKGKALKIAEDAANYLLGGTFEMDCRKTFEKDFKFVDPSKAVVTDENDYFWGFAFKGQTSDGYGFEISLDVAKDNSGSYTTSHKKVICKPK